VVFPLADHRRAGKQPCHPWIGFSDCSELSASSAVCLKLVGGLAVVNNQISQIAIFFQKVSPADESFTSR
jgi:hypothetical protein